MVIIFSFSSNRIQLDTMLNHDVFFIFIFMRVQTVKTQTDLEKLSFYI